MKWKAGEMNKEGSVKKGEWLLGSRLRKRSEK